MNPLVSDSVAASTLEGMAETSTSAPVFAATETAPLPIPTFLQTAMAPARVSTPAVVLPPITTWQNSTFNASVSFQTTAVHRFNRLAVAMMQKASRLCFASLSPEEVVKNREFLICFLHGGYSQGKTHLLHASINEFMATHQCASEDLAIFSGSSFSEQVQQAVTANSLNAWIKSVSTAKAFFMDDLHNCSQSAEVQDALIQLFENFNHAYKSIFYTALQAPSSFSHFCERLSCRLQWGLLLGFEKIDRAQRQEILESRMSALGLTLPKSLLDYLASLELDNLRSIDAHINHLTQYSSVMREDLNVDTLRRFTQPVQPQIRRTITIEDIEVFIMERFNIAHDDMISPKRSRNIAFPRQIAMYLTHEYTHTSMESIGNYYGGRDHSTVKHACEKIRDSLSSDHVIKSILERFRETFC